MGQRRAEPLLAVGTLHDDGRARDTVGHEEVAGEVPAVAQGDADMLHPGRIPANRGLTPISKLALLGVRALLDLTPQRLHRFPHVRRVRVQRQLALVRLDRALRIARDLARLHGGDLETLAPEKGAALRLTLATPPKGEAL